MFQIIFWILSKINIARPDFTAISDTQTNILINVQDEFRREKLIS